MRLPRDVAPTFLACVVVVAMLDGCASSNEGVASSVHDNTASEPASGLRDGMNSGRNDLTASVTAISVRDSLCGNDDFALVDVTLDKGFVDNVYPDMVARIGEHTGVFLYDAVIGPHQSTCLVYVHNDPATVSLPKVGDLARLSLVAGASKSPMAYQPPIDQDIRGSLEQLRRDDAALHAARSTIEARRAEINRELASLATGSALPPGHWAHEWAGRYSLSNMSLCISPEAGAVYTWYGCFGLEDGNLGCATGTFDSNHDGIADGLEVTWALVRPSGFGFDSKRLYFVRWDGAEGSQGRRYLVPESKMIDVVNDFNRGWELMSAPLRDDDRDWYGRSQVVGAPTLPARWAEHLRDPASTP